MKNILYLAFVLTSCKVAIIPIEEAFASAAEIYEVSGKNGWQINQKLSFGPYETEAIDRSMTFTYEVPFLMDFAGAKEGISFQLFDQEMRRAVNFYGTSELQDARMGMVRGYFQFSLKQKDAFSGSIVFAQPEVHYYDFCYSTQTLNSVI